MVTGGYGAGKSHMKEFLRRNKINNLEFLEPLISSIMQSEEERVPIHDIYSLILLQTRPFLDALYDSIKKRMLFSSSVEANEEVKKTMRTYFSDNDFIDIYCAYLGFDNGNRGNYRGLEEFIIKKSEQLFLPLMKLYKKYLDINGFCIFIDEFESLQFLTPRTRAKFIQSIRPFYDSVASTSSDLDLPSLKLIVLCTLSVWNDLTKDARSQAIESRFHLFEIPPLREEEIISLAEKICVIHNKSGYPAPKFDLDFDRLPGYLVHRAGIEAPLTPRFVINEIITVIEKPNDYLEFNS
jgi:hypothetical protein